MHAADLMSSTSASSNRRLVLLYATVVIVQGSSYLGEAVERVVGHNFTGDETEPPTGAGAAGWKGDIHDRKQDG
jgi:hypothetical protein